MVVLGRVPLAQGSRRGLVVAFDNNEARSQPSRWWRATRDDWRYGADQGSRGWLHRRWQQVQWAARVGAVARAWQTTPLAAAAISTAGWQPRETIMEGNRRATIQRLWPGVVLARIWAAYRERRKISASPTAASGMILATFRENGFAARAQAWRPPGVSACVKGAF